MGLDWGVVKQKFEELSSDTSRSDYWLVRWLLLRVLGFTYLFAFLSLAFQVIPLIGSKGILPADVFLEQVAASLGGTWEGFMRLPSIFWLHVSDTFLLTLAILGVLISLALFIGYANVPLLFINWALYMSFVHVGQLWYGYGWEIQLLETGFLAMFLVPLWNPRPFSRDPPPVPVIWLFRWLAFRIHLGAGLIKLRGSECWEKLTCLYYHYETQPIPNPLSPWLHALPKWFDKLGVLMTHFVQMVSPFFVLLGKWMRNFGGVLMLGFQLMLVLSGNLAFLNWVTIVAIISYFDDSFLAKFFPKVLVDRASKARKNANEPGIYRKITTWVLVAIVIGLSIPVVTNLFSSEQAMNTSFNQLKLVNTYGAFGSVGKVRNELIVQGTLDEELSVSTEWKTYDFKYKPDFLDDGTPIIAPYQPRLEWQLWFAAMSRPEREPWLINYVWKLLHNDDQALSLLKENPFPDDPPEHVRIQLYRYEFREPWDGDVWKRELVGTWLPPVNKENQQIRRYVKRWE